MGEGGERPDELHNQLGLQQEVADAFVASWDELIENIGHKIRALTAA